MEHRDPGGRMRQPIARDLDAVLELLAARELRQRRPADSPAASARVPGSGPCCGVPAGGSLPIGTFALLCCNRLER